MLVDDLYLGDGVYASFDGFGVVLDLRGQDMTTRIVLEETVCDALIAFMADAWKAAAEARKVRTIAEKRADPAGWPAATADKLR